MKNFENYLLFGVVFGIFSCVISCEKEPITNSVKVEEYIGKPFPNIETERIELDENHPTIKKLFAILNQQYKKNKTEGILEPLSLNGYFGKIQLDNGVELKDSLNRTTTTFDVKELNNNPNIYYNFVFHNEKDLWLYKIEKLTTSFKNLPPNSTLITKTILDESLMARVQCDTIKLPPFGTMQSEIVPNSLGGGGSPTSTIGVPQNGFPGIPFGGMFPNTTIFIPNVGTGNSTTVGNSSTPSGTNPNSSTTGGMGNNYGGGIAGGSSTINSVATDVGDFFTDIWDAFLSLFHAPCKCPKKLTNGGSVEPNLTATGRGIVLEIGTAPTRCSAGDGGYVYINIQDLYVDKIRELANKISFLHNNDLVYLYENLNIVYDIEMILQQTNNNQNIIEVLPYLTDATRKNKMLWTTAKKVQQYILEQNNSDALTFALDLTDLTKQETDDNLAKQLAELTIMFESSNNIFSDQFGAELNSFTNISPPYSTSIYPFYEVQLKTFKKYKLLRTLNPGWSRAKCIWEATKDIIHISLDAFGLIPVVVKLQT